jgi:hypothetical protein
MLTFDPGSSLLIPVLIIVFMLFCANCPAIGIDVFKGAEKAQGQRSTSNNIKS